jgi:hypothetical protein
MIYWVRNQKRRMVYVGDCRSLETEASNQAVDSSVLTGFFYGAELRRNQIESYRIGMGFRLG